MPTSATTLLGLVLYVLAFPMTIMNERAAVVSYLQHGEGLNLVHEFNPDDLSSQEASTAASYHQKLLHITTTLFPDTPLTVRDPDFGITVEGNFVLERRVEMLQWLEDDNAENSIDLEGDVEGTTDLLPSSNRFSYSLEWSSDSISSMSYHDRETHSNPTFAIQSQTFTPPNGLNIVPHYDSGKNHPISTLQFRLASQDIRNFIKPKTLFYIHEDTIHMAGVDGSGTSILAGAGTRPKAAGKGLKKLRRSDFELHDGMIYTKTLPSVLSTATTTTTNSDSIVAPNNPGALRISYRVTSMATGLSVLSGVDATGTLVPFALPSGKQLFMVRVGPPLSATQMLRRADFENSVRLNTIRLFSFGMLFFGSLYLMVPLQVYLSTSSAKGMSRVLENLSRVGVCRSSFVGAAMVLSVIIGVLWVNVDVSV